MSAAVKNLLIGLFVFAAFGVIIFMLLFLHPTIGDNAKTLRVLFSDIDKVNVGTRVTFAGKPVGEVISIQELPDARTSRINEHGTVYIYKLVLKVDSSVDVFNTDVISLRTSGLLGERSIEIDPRPLKPGEQLVKVEDRVLFAAQTTSVEDTMQQIKDLSSKFSVVLDDFHVILEDFRHQKILDNLSKTSENILHLSEKANESWKSVDESLQAVHDLADRAHRSWTTVDDTLAKFDKAASNVLAVTEDVREGKGTIGELLVNPEMALRVKSILHKGETVMRDINTYGLLFHLDKRWQRLQGKRLHILERLHTPEAFAAYFDKEMQDISDSLDRVAITLNAPSCDLMTTPCFAERFADLLRRVEGMEDTLKLFNEQAVGQEGCR